ncbi:hypothetical protein ACFQ0T_15125 [Kitasatospora gansuensis]
MAEPSGNVLNGHRTTVGTRAAQPSVLIATRHGESTANVEFRLADETGALTVPITSRDADIPLSLHGQAQAQALGRWWAALPRPTGRARSGARPTCGPPRRPGSRWPRRADSGRCRSV